MIDPIPYLDAEKPVGSSLSLSLLYFPPLPAGWLKYSDASGGGLVEAGRASCVCPLS